VASQPVLQLDQHEACATGSGSRGLIPVRQVQIPSEEQRPPRTLPAATQDVEHVLQQSCLSIIGDAEVLAVMAMKAAKMNENCILIWEKKIFKVKIDRGGLLSVCVFEFEMEDF
jgi:hypothetical protein